MQKIIVFLYQQLKIEDEFLKDTIYNTKNAKFLGINLMKVGHEIYSKSYKMFREIEEPLNK